jgi:hypothetical protein
MLTLQTGINDSIFEILEEDEKMRIVTARSFGNPEERESFYKTIGLKTINEYRQASVNAEPLQRLHYLLLAGDVLDAVSFFINFVKQYLGIKFVEIREMIKLLELADLDCLNPNDLTQVVCISLYFACYGAVWKGYAKIFKKLQDRMLEISRNDSAAWFTTFALEAVQAIDRFNTPKNEAHIYAVGHRFLNSRSLGHSFDPAQKYGKLYYLEDGKSFCTMDGALMWFDLTPFSPISIGSRHYIL